MIALLLVAIGCGGKEGTKGEEGIERDELGLFTTEADGGVDVPFEVPAGAVATLVYCGPYGYDHVVTAETITDPTGAVVYDRATPGGPIRVDDQTDLLAVLIPQAPELDLSEGAWTVRLHSYATDAISVQCYAAHRTSPVGEPTIDLNFVFVGADEVAPGLNAAEAPETMESVIDTLTTLWGGGGLAIGDVSWSDFDGDVATYATLEGAEELGDLLRTVSDGRSLTYFVVQGMTDDAGAQIDGGGAGPPGAASIGATSKSGVAVRADGVTDPGGADAFARILAHEGLHFLGLYDTTEHDGVRTDPLADTPECTDTDDDGLVNTDECEGRGTDNLMWWSGGSDAVELTDDQAWVLARSLAVR